MSHVLMADPAGGAVALFEEAPGGGAVADTGSLRNRPLVDPASWMANVRFHSSLDHLEVASETSVTINHAAVAGGTAYAGVGQAVTFNWSTTTADWLLVTHGLGYVPHVMVTIGDTLVHPGLPVQIEGTDGRMRFVTVYATTTEVRLFETASVGATALSAASVTYDVLVIKEPPAPAGTILLDFDPSDGTVEMGLGKFDSARRYLQVVPGGSPFAFFREPPIDLANGAVRFVRADGTAFDPVPSAQVARVEPGTGTYGASMAYSGSYAPTGIVEVQAP